MVQVPNTADLPQPLSQLRRHNDPPQLWVAVAIASLGVHAWLLAITLPMMRGSTAQSQTTSVPIELIELAPNTTTVGETAGTSPSATTPSTARPSAANAPQSGSTASPSQLSPTQIAPTETITPPPDQFREPDVTPSDRPTPKPSVPPASPSPQSSADIPTEPPQESSPPEQQIPSSDLPSPDTGNVNPENSSDSALNDPLPNVPSPDGSSSSNPTSPSPGNLIPEQNLPNVVVAQEAQFSSFSANVETDGLVPEVERIDVHAFPPQPISRTQTYDPNATDFGNCLLSSGSVSDFGQTVYLQVTVEPDGSVSDAYARPDRNSEISDAYLELAQCLVKTWRFQPAYDVDPNTGQQIAVADSNSIVAITIERQK